MPLWQRTEEELGQLGLPPPFWAFAWLVGRRWRATFSTIGSGCGQAVLDFASGSGLVAIAAAMAGASHVTAADIDPSRQPPSA